MIVLLHGDGKGADLFACGGVCATVIAALLGPDLALDVHPGTPEPWRDCSHCAWCGVRTTKPAGGACIFHGSQCPDRVLQHTVVAAVVALQAGRSVVADDGWRALARVLWASEQRVGHVDAVWCVETLRGTREG